MEGKSVASRFVERMNIGKLKTIYVNFLQELRDAENGRKTSLRFIIHNCPSKSIVKDGEVFQVMVIGGSVFKKAILKKTKYGIKILKKENEKPVSFASRKVFLSFINNELFNNVDTLALNFAYPSKPVFANGRLDGILLEVTKEGRFNDLIGKKVGSEIENYILKKRKKKVIVSLANDTICLLLSGLTRYSFDKLATGIVSTGLNFAFYLDKNTLVNLESGNFDKFPQSKEGKIIDRLSQKQGRYIFEKETAGVYLYKHFNLILKNKKLNFSPISSTKELDKIARQNIPQVSTVARKLLNKSAQLVACQIAGITSFKKYDMVFNMEGSLFWKGNNYKETVEQTVKELVPQYKIEFVEIKDSAILGAGKLVA